MAMSERDLREKERISRTLEVHLKEWKEVIVFLNEIIVLKTFWYFVVTVTCLTISYIYIWLVNCSTFNIIWTVCLCASLLDSFVCGPLKIFLPPNTWNKDKQYMYTEISDSLAHYYVVVKLYAVRFFSLRQSNRILFHLVLITLFCALLYLGKTFNNLLVSYIMDIAFFSIMITKKKNYKMQYLHQDVMAVY